MAASSGTQPTIRKAIAALKDSTKVGLVNLNSENKGLDIAIVKATNHDEALPKEKHINRILEAVSASRPRADVAYCIQSLAKRLAKTHSWTVALKTLIVIHRGLREVDSSFCEELINYSRGRALMLNLSHFRDESSPVAWDHSAWIRNYALYLEERVECFRIMGYDVEKTCKRSCRLSIQELLDQLPSLQQLLFRLLGCKPQGAALYNDLINYALSIVAGESVKLYVTITDGILKLVDKYFEMPRHDALRTLEIYRKSESQADTLTALFEICRGLEFGRGQKYIKIEKPPASFMTAMEDYVKEAPHIFMIQDGDQDIARIEGPKLDATPEADLSTNQQDTEVKIDSDQLVATPEQARNDQSEKLIDTADTQKLTDQTEAAATQEITDLLGLEELTQQVSELDEKNSLALAIVTPESQPKSENSFTMACQTMGWELALVTAPSSNVAAVAGSKLAGGLDMLTLDSLYDNAIVVSANQNGTNTVGKVSSNPFEADCLNQDPFSSSSSVAPPINVQMSDMIQQQNFMAQQQQPQLQLQQQDEPQMTVQNVTNSSNPFLD